VIEDPPRAPAGAAPAPSRFDARSAAEATLFEALEADPQTARRFELNGDLGVRFGARAAEIDLLSRGHGIAIEIDGVHHFADPECYRRDRRKDVLMQLQGLFVIRLLAEDVLRDVRGAVEVVRRVMGQRAVRSR
jgi:very-short-patch-repair endonuclease